MKHFTPDLAVFEEIQQVYSNMNITANEKAEGEIEWEALMIRDFAQTIIDNLDGKDKIRDSLADIRQSCNAIMELI